MAPDSLFEININIMRKLSIPQEENSYNQNEHKIRGDTEVTQLRKKIARKKITRLWEEVLVRGTLVPS